ncbi:Wdr65, partial [Symbiodinium microadriaticum]
LSRLWLGQIGTYVLTWTSLKPLLRQMSPDSFRSLLAFPHGLWRWVLSGFMASVALGFVVAPLGRGQVAPGPLLPELSCAAQLAGKGDTWAVASLILLVGLLAPAFEELFFRGFLLLAFSKSNPIFWSSFLFGLFHCHPQQLQPFRPLVPSAAMGALFALMLQRTGSLPVAIFLHQLWNGLHLFFVACLASWHFSERTIEKAAICYV